MNDDRFVIDKSSNPFARDSPSTSNKCRSQRSQYTKVYLDEKTLVITSLSALPLSFAAMFLSSEIFGYSDHIINIFALISMASSIPFMTCLVVLGIRNPSLPSFFGNWAIKNRGLVIIFLIILYITISYFAVYIRRF